MNIRHILEEEVLPFVQKPARYIGGEINAIARPAAEVRLLLSYPDVYEVGMSHLGLQILYDIVNREERYAAERAFAVWPDMEQKMREKGVPLFSSSHSARRWISSSGVFRFSPSSPTPISWPCSTSAAFP